MLQPFRVTMLGMSTVAIFSSTEGRARARALELAIRHAVEVTPTLGPVDVRTWDGGDAHPPGSELLAGIRRFIESADYVVCMLEQDDVLMSRGEQHDCARDNIVFELGLAIALKGLERCCATVPMRGAKLAIHIPGDLAGVNLVRYTPAPRTAERAVEDRGQFAQVAQTVLETMAKHRTAGNRSSGIRITHANHDHIAPVYSKIAGGREHLNWFHNFRTSLRQALVNDPATLPSQLLYYGPGMAQRWLSEADQSDANRQQWESFQRFIGGHFRSVLRTFESDMELLTVVDLGVGDFEKARTILNAALTEIDHARPARALQYVAYDVSHDMVVEALHRSTQGALRQTVLRNGGTLMGVHDEFAHLRSYTQLWHSTSATLYCLLGNTLGNDPVEDRTLQVIRQSMRPQDRLLIEVQLADDVPVEVMTTAANEALHFFGGPFLVCGVPVERLVCDVRKSAFNAHGGLLAEAYAYYLTFGDSSLVAHMAFGGPDDEELRVSERRSIRTYLVKKYHVDTFARMLDDLGFVSAVPPIEIPSGHRRFAYYCLSARSTPLVA